MKFKIGDTIDNKQFGEGTILKIEGQFYVIKFQDLKYGIKKIHESCLVATSKQRALEYLRKALNDNSAKFRDGQFECIEKILQHKRILSVQRTGYGKSMIYFIATRLLRDQNKGPTLLISPLLSLMRNQITAAHNIGINAKSVNSTNTDDTYHILEDLKQNKIDLLIVSPERLNNDTFKQKFIPILSNIGLLVVDEAHCISDWGHDFRPDYKRITQLLNNMPSNVPVLATTATANKRVVEDIKKQIGSDLFIQRGSLVRSSLKLQNINLPQKAHRMAWLAQNIPLMKGSGIVYTLTQRDAEYVAKWLRFKGIEAKEYHADIDTKIKEQLETDLINNKIKVLVATVALGMGFDKSDLAFVIHFQRPASVVHYYQQVGRAGRGISEAYGILLHGKEDDEIAEYFLKKSFPPSFCIDQVLQILRHHNGLSITDMQQRINITKLMLEKTLKYLLVEDRSPILKYGYKYYLSVHANNYKYDVDSVNKIIEIRKNEQKQMQEYMNYKGCLMAFLQKALDDDSSQNCGKCSNCSETPLFSEVCDFDICNEATAFMKRNYHQIPPRKRMDGHIIPENEQAFDGKALCLWNDAGWGELVANGKYKFNNFADELVDACVKMIDDWFNDTSKPYPKWVTCIPSLSRPMLVPNFAERLAKKLNLPFIPCIKKIKQNKQQKQMENSCQQFLNVKDVFSVDTQNISQELLTQPCFLVDDVVDSRWTFTVVANLLMKAGCTGVYPMALAKNTTETE